MSFLNPVNEPVLRFKSTDAGAPQINYAARTAGDVKAVLKACLITGYGTTASAGWSIVNEVDHVCEFVSPSVAMSDYRLGIDDSSAANTTWYYYYQDVRVNPARQAIDKTHGNIKLSTNGWELLVTQRGLCFVEILNSAVISDLVARVVYIGQPSSMFKNDSNRNMLFWNFGMDSANPPDFFRDTINHNIVNNTNSVFHAANIPYFTAYDDSAPNDKLSISMTAPLYLVQLRHIVAQVPGMYLHSNNNPEKQYGVYDDVVDERQFLSVCTAYNGSSVNYYKVYARVVKIAIDFWSY